MPSTWNTPASAGFGIRPLLLARALPLCQACGSSAEPLRDKIRESATLANDSPPAEVVREMILQADNPACGTAWQPGSREKLSIGKWPSTRSANWFLTTAFTPDFESLVLAGALDPDVNVREIALGLLRDRKDPALAAMAAEQLKDAG